MTIAGPGHGAEPTRESLRTESDRASTARSERLDGYELQPLVQRALDSAGDSPLVSLNFEAPRVSPDVLLRQRGAAPSVLWSPPGAIAFSGFGSAFEVSAEGAERFRRCAALGSEALHQLREVVCSSADAGGEGPLADAEAPPGARLFGGFSFQTSAPGKPSLNPPWESFGEARFILPRVRYAACADRAWLSLTLKPGERDATAISEEVAQLLAGLRAPAGNTSRRSRPAEACSDDLPPSVLRAEPSPIESWRKLVEGILEVIEAGGAEKIVAARKTRYTLAAQIDPLEVLEQLQGSRNVNRVAFRFAEAELVAATPERLLRRAGRQIHTEALAGTLGTARPEAVRALLESRKDRAEHAYVVLEILRCLQPFCETIEAAEEPVVRELRHVVHLQTPIVGELKASPARHILDLVEALHPTPAVGGVPRQLALDWISQHEPLDRGWYAGPLGWFDAAGDGEFWVGLRSGVFHKNHASLYAGAGIVRGSETDSEYAETEVKLTGLIRALGIAD